MQAHEELFQKITKQLENPKGVVQISTPLRSWLFKAKHVGFFKLTKTGVFMQRGKSWDCIATPSTVLVAVRFGTEG